MTYDASTGDLTDLCAEAALELEELRQGFREDAPALNQLVEAMLTPAPAYNGESVSMLADVRSYALLRDSLDSPKQKKEINFQNFADIMARYLKDLQIGVSTKAPAKLIEA